MVRALRILETPTRVSQPLVIKGWAVGFEDVAFPYRLATIGVSDGESSVPAAVPPWRGRWRGRHLPDGGLSRWWRAPWSQARVGRRQATSDGREEKHRREAGAEVGGTPMSSASQVPQ